MVPPVPESDREFALEVAALADELVTLVDAMESDLDVRDSLGVELSHRLFRLRVKAERLLDRNRPR